VLISGHLAAILFYTNYKVKNSKFGLETGLVAFSMPQLCRKSLVPHFYPNMHLDDYWKPLFRNPSSLYRDVPRDALSVKILSTVEISCTTNPQQIEWS